MGMDELARGGLLIPSTSGFIPDQEEFISPHKIRIEGIEDIVRVVRCKDCRKISPSVTPVKNAVWCREFRAYMPCDGFCSYGERRE